MSYNGQLVVDMDCHIREYWDLDRTFKGYVDPEYRDKYDRLSAAVRANQRRPGDTGSSMSSGPGLQRGRLDYTTRSRRTRLNRGTGPGRAAASRSTLRATGTRRSACETWIERESTLA